MPDRRRFASLTDRNLLQGILYDRPLERDIMRTSRQITDEISIMMGYTMPGYTNELCFQFKTIKEPYPGRDSS